MFYDPAEAMDMDVSSRSPKRKIRHKIEDTGMEIVFVREGIQMPSIKIMEGFKIKDVCVRTDNKAIFILLDTGQLFIQMLLWKEYVSRWLPLPMSFNLSLKIMKTILIF